MVTPEEADAVIDNWTPPLNEVEQMRIARDFIQIYFNLFEVEEVPQDAVEQLVLAFMPALGKMVERRHNGAYREVWKRFGWRGALYESRKNIERLWNSWWLAEPSSTDPAVDLLNYTGFFLRAVEDLNEWGEIGGPSQTSSDVG